MKNLEEALSSADLPENIPLNRIRAVNPKKCRFNGKEKLRFIARKSMKKHLKIDE